MAVHEVLGMSCGDLLAGRRRDSGRRLLGTAPGALLREHLVLNSSRASDTDTGNHPLATWGGVLHGHGGPGSWWTRYRNALVLVDAVAVGIALLVATVVRFSGPGSGHVVGLASVTYPVFSVALGIGWLVLLAGARAYSKHAVAVGDAEYRRVIRSSFLLFGALSMVAVLFQLDFARGYLAIALPLGLLLLLLGRWGARQVVVRRRARGRMLDDVLLIGSPEAVRWTAERIARTPAAGYRVHSVACGLDDAPGVLELSDGTRLPVLGGVRETREHLERTGLGTVIVADDAHADRKFLRRLSWQLEDTPVQLAVTSRLTDVAGPRIHWRPVEGLPIMTVDTPRYSGFKYVLKRGFDLATALVALVLAAPVMLVVAAAVKLEDGGPVFYRQRRVGINGGEFTMTKFRSMRVDADQLKEQLAQINEGAGPLFKLRSDPRVTRVGRVIRKYSLDELPQLLDVLRGQMSVVGPRPQLPEEVARLAPHQRRRLKVKPGITGPWQVGGRSNLPADESVRLDLTYVENWSLSGDLIIVLKTAKAVLARDGAY